jgi:CheY-like chemotaxis protein
MSIVLVIDDQESILSLFSYVLQDAGFQPLIAHNGIEALELVKSKKPDFMIVDFSMPEMNGWDFIKELNKISLRNPELKAIPYIVMTGEDFMSQSREFRFEEDRNFKRYFVKMTDPQEIIEYISKQIKK